MEMALRERRRGWGRVGVLLGGAAEGERLTRVKILTIEYDFRIFGFGACRLAGIWGFLDDQETGLSLPYLD